MAMTSICLSLHTSAYTLARADATRHKLDHPFLLSKALSATKSLIYRLAELNSLYETPCGSVALPSLQTHSEVLPVQT